MLKKIPCMSNNYPENTLMYVLCVNDAKCRASQYNYDVPSSDTLNVPTLLVSRYRHLAVEYQVQRNDDITNALITGYEVTLFGVPMIGQYVNAYKGRRVTISPAVPGAQYRITAWALISDGRRSATPAVVYATTGSECIRMQNLMCACARACEHQH